MTIVNSKKAVIQELIKCGKDPVYFLNNYAKVQHPTKGLVPFKTYQYQNDIVNAYLGHRKNIILKARQLGITTITAGYATWLIMFHKDKNVLVVATKQDVAKNVLRMVKIILKHLPRWMKDFLKLNAKDTVWNRHSVELDNGSRIKAQTTTEGVGRTEGVSFLVIDEVAHIKNFDDIWTGIRPTISTGGNVALMSTPCGTGNFFHKCFLEAQNNSINGFNCKLGTYINPENPSEVFDDRLMWWVHPDHNRAWFESETTDMSHREISQEHCCFTGDTRVFTKFGFKKIKNIKVGDEVLTHKGNFEKVIKTNNRNASDLFAIKTFSNHRNSYVTSDHPILHEKNGWMCAVDLKEKENICAFPKNIEIPTTSVELDLLDLIKPDHFKLLLTDDGERIFINDRKHKTQIHRFIKVDYDLGYLIGLYLAEGHKTKNSFSLSFNLDKELNTWVVRVCDILKDKFNFDKSKIYDSNTKCSVLTINSQIISKVISLFVNGNSCYNKKLSKFSYKNGNLKFYEGIVDGMFLGDGCIKFEYNKSYTTVSESLIYDLQYLMSCCGFKDFSIRKQNKSGKGKILGRNVSISDSYEIKLLRTRMKACNLITELKEREQDKYYKYKNIFKDNENFQISAIEQKKQIDESKTVYNIEVEKDHSFVTEHFVVHNCNFNASGDTFIYYKDIEVLEQNIKRPIDTYHKDRNIWIWQQPDQRGRYLIPCDVSRGDAADFSAFHVLRLDSNPINQVAEYKGKIKPDELGLLLAELSEFYSQATIAPENNSGWAGQTILKIQESGCSNLYYSRKRPEKQRRHHMIDPYFAKNRNDYIAGYSVTSANRNAMLSKMEQYIRLREIIINSSRTVDEIKTFIVDQSNKPIAQRGANDDLVMSLAGGLWVRDEAFLYYDSSEMTDAMIEGMSYSDPKTNSYSDFNFSKPGIYDRGRIKKHVQNQNKIILGNGDVEDLTWLYGGIYKG